MKDQILSLLKEREKSGEVLFWRYTETKEEKREFYSLAGNLDSQSVSSFKKIVELDQVRHVNESSFYLEVWVPKQEDSQKQGYAKKRFRANGELVSQLEEALTQAQVSSQKKWKPKDFQSQGLSMPKKCFPGFREDFLLSSQNIYKELCAAIEATSGGEFNSSELFCIRRQTQTHTSNGFEGENWTSRIYAEVCFSSQKGEESQEFLVTDWACHPDQLNFTNMCKESVEYAEALLYAEPTSAGQYKVALKSDVLNEVLHDLLRHLDASNEYYKMPFKPLGSELIEGFESKSFSLWLDPQKDWAFASIGHDGWGRRQDRIKLADLNRVEAHSVSQQMAQYLGKQESSITGVLEVVAHGEAPQLLLQSGEVLEILQFSGLFTSAMDLTFSSEIRLARLWNKEGQFRYLKGGSLSGSIKEHFRKVRWSDTMVLKNKFEGEGMSYSGPDLALIEGVPVTS